jgi:hypothetical protein
MMATTFTSDVFLRARKLLDDAQPDVQAAVPAVIALFNENSVPNEDGTAFITKYNQGLSKEEPVEPPVDIQTNVPDTAYTEFKNYLTAIFRPGDTLCFVGIDHSTGKNENEFVDYSRAVSREYFEDLSRANSVASIYVATNAFPAELIGQKTGRTQENVVAVRALQADMDDAANAATVVSLMQSGSKVPPPSLVVESSTGKRQAIWTVDDFPKDDAKPVMQSIAKEFGTDSAVADTARVMRVPGFVNRKPKYTDKPVAKLLTNTGKRYRRGDFHVEVATKFEQRVAPEEYLNAPFIRKGGKFGGIYPHVLKIVGHYVSKVKDGDVMFAIVNTLKERNGCFQSDGVTPYEWNGEQVHAQVLKQTEEWKNQNPVVHLTMNQQPTQQQVAAQDTSNWREMFRSVGEMEDGPIDMIIEGALQEGTCFLGANPGDGKTLVALAFAKAICTGTPLFGLPQYSVSKPRPVIYLIPESRDRAFRKRCEAFRIPNDKSKFMARTISAGVPLELGDPYLMQAVKETNAVVILDTASRFMKGNDENSAAQNRILVNDVVALLAAGAVCVILIHHATKSAKTNGEKMTLENMLRGTGDFGAMCDQAYGIRKDMNLYANGSGPMEIELVNLKDREQIGGLTSVRLAASWKSKMTPEGKFESMFPQSYINETGNFVVVSDSATAQRQLQMLLKSVKDEPAIPASELAKRFPMTEYAIKALLHKNGWHRVKGGPEGASPWHQDNGQTCPYEKQVEVKPSKKTYDATLTEAVQKLGQFLGEADEGVAEAGVYRWADKEGITDAMLAKAKKRLGVIRDREAPHAWALPDEPEQDANEAF